eukprot:CAMPEP_0170860598 /NCGR_PEP_ID=MMETSP0734-20130129/17605_1 /TAXON_ID=186038 /ORGANISM="Fragilariopsis kerguelensis, Strain L26-C5" /LENGTH=449 /DNA_ID=CAMNT_0011234301 /DNA_START=28 /DNA_END=1377 /DNA_ORIENTATION=+
MTTEYSSPLTDYNTILSKVTNLSSNDDDSDNNNDAENDDLFLYMPAEWAYHNACLILFPHNPNTFRVEKASTEIMDLVFSIATVGREAVYLLCKNKSDANIASKQVEDEKTARQYCKDSNNNNENDDNGNFPIYVDICPSDDTWARDTAPIFVWQQRKKAAKGKIVKIEDGERERGRQRNSQQLIGLDWEFNAYGGPKEGCYWPCTNDRKIARIVCDGINNTNSLNIQKSLSIPMILEGGAICTDGEGTLLTTSECLNNPNRNPHLSQNQIETILIHALGVSKVLWLPYGLDADEDTNGHIDNFCAFVHPGHVVLTWTDDDRYDVENYNRCREAERYLQSNTDALGRALEITKLYLPSPPFYYTKEEAMSLAFSRQPGEKIAASYVNFYISNGAILVPQFGMDAKETDRRACETLRPLFPDRKVVGVSSREILLGGGNIHCQTQQIPSY